MHASRTIYAALALILSSSCAASSKGSFEANYAAANRNYQTADGVAYDKALSAVFEHSPDFTPNVSKCLSSHPGPQSVHGYFSFTSATEYQIVLEPKSDFSICLAKALEHHTVPAPPSVPYLNPFTFTFKP